jgi:carbon storage regulator CsrA
MLVLSRRPQEKIVFPHLEIEVEILGVSGNTVRVGVNAPRKVLVLRHEVALKDAAKATAATENSSAPVAEQQPAAIAPVATAPGVAKPTEAISAARKWVHQLRNYLNTANLAVQVAQAQLERGDDADVDAKLTMAIEHLRLLDEAISSGPSPAVVPASRPANNEVVRLSESLPPAAEPVEVREEQEQPASRHKPLALVVEDNENESALLAAVLRDHGFRVETATDGCHALDYLATHKKPDVVLLDMRMPRCDGPTTISKIRSNPRLSDLRVVAVSGYRSSDLGVRTGPQGVDRWFCKPLDPSRLVHELKHDLHVSTGAERPDKGRSH